MESINSEERLIEISGDVKSLITKVELVCEDIRYMTQVKNKHEERLSYLEKKIPDKLDERLRNLELKTYIISIVVPIIISLIISYIQKLVL
jgi:hypothetical protein